MGNIYTKNLERYTFEEVTKHNKNNDIWIIIDGYVYDFSRFNHPGGQSSIIKLYGSDASKVFHTIALHSNRHKKKIKEYIIGKLID